MYNAKDIKPPDPTVVPIRKGCSNANGCFCTGACQEIVGWEKPKRFPLCMEFDKDKTHESLMFIGGAKLK
jgi:hypothetical protein